MHIKTIKDNLPVILVWLCVFLLPFGRSVEAPVAIMAVWALWLIKHKGRTVWWAGGARLFTIVFLMFWIPALVSALDAENMQKTLKTVLTLPRFYFAGLFIIHTLSSQQAWVLSLSGSAWVLVFWIMDALLQFVTGYNSLGYELDPSRLNGVFGEEHLKFGLVVPVFLVLLLEHMRHNWRPAVQAGVLLIAVAMILLAGSRAGWIMLAIVLLAYTAAVIVRSRRQLVVMVLGGVILIGGLSIGGYHISEGFKKRVDQSLLVFSGDAAQIDVALSTRLPIWRTAVLMIAEHPINGVGARGFRYAYPRFAAASDPFLNSSDNTGAMHSHQLVLEVLAETGVVGLAGLLLAMGLLIRAWLTARTDQRRWMRPGGIAVLAAFFPVNTHFALYSSFWSQIVWFMIAIYCAGIMVHRDRAGSQHRESRSCPRV